MGKLERAFISTADKTYKKVQAKNGRTMHFKDGTPISKGTFNMVATKYKKYEGQKVKVAIPSDKGPGYERIEINPIEASSFGQELYYHWENREHNETVTIDGKEYKVEDLAEFNENIIDRHGSDAVFRYN